MKIYETTTIQYLDAETVGGEAGWYAVEGGMSASAEGAISSLTDMGDALADMPVILNAAAQDVERPAYLNTVSATFIVEDDFAPAETYSFDANQADDIYNSIEFSQDLTLSVATVTEYTSGLSFSHSSLTLTFTGSVGQIFEMHFEYAQSDFSFGWGAGEAVDLETFISNLDANVLSETIQKGTQGFDHIEGDWQDNEIDGVGGIDTIKGYGGNDTISLDAGSAYGGEGNDVITTHTDGVDYKVSLYGEQGNDTLVGGDKNDNLSGGTGTDTASYESSDAGVNVNLGTGKAKGGDAAGDKFSSIENLMGSDHNDILKGNDGVNKLEGGKGDDAFEGSFGADTIIGGEGSYTAVYTTSHKGVSVNLQKGTAKGGDAAGDTLISIENLKGSVHNDILVGDEGDNMLVGRSGNDRLKGNDGQDTLDGGYGNDVLISENDGNVLIGGAGCDVFDLSRVEDLSDIATDIIKDFQHGLDTIKLSKAHMGDDNVVTAIETTMNGVEGLALTTNVGNSTVNFAFLEGVSDLSASDFDGDHIPTIDVV